MKVLLQFILLTFLFSANCFASKHNTCTKYSKLTGAAFAIPTVTIISSAYDLCKGATISFTAAVTNGGANPKFEWKINGKIIAGENRNIFSTAALSNGDVIQCLLTVDPNTPGLEAFAAASNTISLNVFTEFFPVVTISESANNVCPGSPVQFSVQTKNTGNNPKYDWKINGVSLSNEQQFTYSNFSDKDQVVCYVTVDNPCNIRPYASNTIIINTKPVPAVTIYPANALVLAGSQLLLQSSVSAPYNSFQWTPADLLVDPLSLSPQTKPLLNNTKFHLSVNINNDCVTFADAEIKVFRKLFIPNSFTPNNDRINDVFRIASDISIILKDQT